jgi:DNA-binding YbaB/EbfC family protein
MAKNPFGKLPGGIGGLGDLMKQAQSAMAAAPIVEAELAEARVEGTASAGVVTVVVSGKCEFISIKIKKEAVDPEDIETLEDLIVIASRDAITKANALREEKLSAIVPGGGLPGGFF